MASIAFSFGCKGNETLEYGCDVVLGPGMNLHRNPLCGRNFEYYSEDPIVTGLIGTAFVQGVQSQGVGVSAKHFAVNSQETDRTKVDERLSQRALRELYLKGFEMMLRKSNPWTIMSAYNKINGVYAQGNKGLLTDILRNDWGYKGIVETDWIGKRADLPLEQEVEAGNDLMMPGYPAQVQDIVDAVKNGKLDIKDVDRNVRRMLEYIVKTPRFKGYKYSGEPDLKAHAAITRQSSTEGMVLLKNDAALPIQSLKTVALFGVNSYDFMSGGLGSGAVNVGYSVDMVTGLKNIGVATTPQLTGYLTQSQEDVEEMFRRMVFNYIMDNKDDHCKNFSFLVQKESDGKWHWHLAPAYDLTHCTEGYNGEHATSVNRTGHPTVEDMIAVGVKNKMKEKRCREIYEEVTEQC
jgi:beta-glucosidase